MIGSNALCAFSALSTCRKQKKQAQGRFPGCLCLPFKSVFVVWSGYNDVLGARCRPLFHVYCRLVSEHQLAIKGIDEDGLVATNLFGQYFLAQVVKYIALDGALNGPCTKLWVVAKVG